MTVTQPCEISLPTTIVVDASGAPRPNEVPAGTCGGSNAPQITTTEASKESGYVVSIEF